MAPGRCGCGKGLWLQGHVAPRCGGRLGREWARTSAVITARMWPAGACSALAIAWVKLITEPACHGQRNASGTAAGRWARPPVPAAWAAWRGRVLAQKWRMPAAREARSAPAGLWLIISAQQRPDQPGRAGTGRSDSAQPHRVEQGREPWPPCPQSLTVVAGPAITRVHSDERQAQKGGSSRESPRPISTSSSSSRFMPWVGISSAVEKRGLVGLLVGGQVGAIVAPAVHQVGQQEQGADCQRGTGQVVHQAGGQQTSAQSLRGRQQRA